MGRPTKFTEEIKAKIIYGVSKGAPTTLACDAAGVCDRTLYLWRQKMRKGEEEYIDFFQKLKEARGKAALVWLDKIDNAIDNGQWQASAWKLERRHHKHYGRNIDVMDLARKINRLEKKLKLQKQNPIQIENK